MTYFGIRLCSLRKQDNLTQLQLADALGVKKSTIGMWENGKREPDFETLEAIADYFNVPINTFFLDDSFANDAPVPGKEEQDLTPLEHEVLSMLRRLTEDQQRSFLDYLKFLLSNQSP